MAEADRKIERDPCFRRVGDGFEQVGWRNCLKFLPAQRMRGVWYTGFEESGFVPNVDTVSLTRDIRALKDSKGSPEFDTYLDLDDKAVMRRIGQPPVERCIRAVAIEFIGRRSATRGGYYVGPDSSVIVVDRLLSAKMLGRVRTLGLAGYDRQCASPAPSETQIKAMDEAEWKQCVAAGTCIPASQIPGMIKQD